MTAVNSNQQTNTLQQNPGVKWFKTHWNRLLKHRKQLFALFAVAAFIVFCFILVTSDFVTGGGFFLGAVFVLTYFYLKLEPDEREWLAEQGLIFVGLLVSGILLAGVVFWLVINIYWWPSTPAVENRPLEAAVPGVALLFSYNPYIAADGQPASVVVKGHNDTMEQVVLEIEVQRPDHVLFETAPLTTTTTLPLLLRIPAGGEVRRSFTLLNERTFTETQKKDNLMVCTRQAGSDEPCEPDSLASKLPIFIEGSQGWRIRTFINSGISESGPLFFLVAVLVPGLVAFLQQYLYLDKRAKEARREKAIKFQQQVSQFRYRLLDKSLTGAEQTLEWLQNQGQGADEKESVDIAKKLIKIAKSSTDSHMLVADVKEWHDECVIAYVMAKEKLKALPRSEEWKKVFNSLNEARYHLPLHEAQPKIYNQFREVEVESEPTLPMQLPDQFAPIASSTPQEANMWTPFANERAENETDALFAKKAFWTEYPLFDELQQTEGKCIKDSLIISGLPGSGRTAMAMALSSALFRPNNPVLALYFLGKHSLREIEAMFARRLLDIIKENPTYLSNLASIQRKLLCQLLAVNLGSENSRVTLTEARDKVNAAGWKQGLGSEEQILLWRSMARTQLELLDRTLEELPHNIRLNRTVAGWPEAISACARALGLDETILILDIGQKEEDFEWVKNEIWPNLRRWHSLGLRVLIFLTSDYASRLDAGHGIVRYEQLEWKRDEIKQFAEWRYRTLLPSQLGITTPASHFTDQLTYNDLVILSEDPLNRERRKESDPPVLDPRRFMELWRCVFTVPDSDPSHAESDRGIKLSREEFDKRIQRCL